MGIRYQISTWNSSTATEAREYRRLKRLDAAQQELWKQIYAMCKADAALDTERAQRLRREFITFCAAGHPLPQRKHYFCHDFVLRTDATGNLDHVRFVAIRDDRR